MPVPSPEIAVIEMPWLDRKYAPWKPVEVTSTMPPMPLEADAPPDLLTPLTPSAAASASQARRSSSDVEGTLRSSRSRSGKSRAKSDGSARPTYLSSGATRAIATARSASLATPSPEMSLVETTAWRCPTSTRNPTSSPSERSDSSTRPSRTSTLCETPRTATASAASAPARLAASTRRCASVESADWSNRSEVLAESADAGDGEEFTNKIPDIEAGWNANRWTHQMCLIHGDFKHFASRKANQFHLWRKVSSIMRAKVLSIMRGDHTGLTSLFKPKPKRLG